MSPSIPTASFQVPPNFHLHSIEEHTIPAEELPESSKGKCHKCGRLPSGGAALKFCGQCALTAYCSAECQRAAWRKHKAICKPRSMMDGDGELTRELKKFKSWLDNYRATLQYFAMRSLALQAHPLERTITHFMFVHIKEKQDPPSKLQTFHLQDAYVDSWAEAQTRFSRDPSLGPHLAQMRQQAATNPFAVHYLVLATFLNGRENLQTLWYDRTDGGLFEKLAQPWGWATCWKEALDTMMVNGRQDIVTVKLYHYREN